MTDEHLMRHWADAHCNFSGDLDRGLLRMSRFVARRFNTRATNSTAYAQAARLTTTAGASGPVARAAMAGAMACLATTLLLLSLALAATAGIHSAAGLAAVGHVILA